MLTGFDKSRAPHFPTSPQSLVQLDEAIDDITSCDRKLILLRDERCEDKEYRYRFLREAEASGNLTHPNIVTTHDAHESNDVHFLVMEFLEGKTLAEVIEETGEMALDEAISIISQCSDALAVAHLTGLVGLDHAVLLCHAAYPPVGFDRHITPSLVQRVPDPD